MTDDSQVDKPAPIVPMSTNELITTIVFGGIVGLFIWGVGLFLEHYVFGHFLCHASSATCGAAKNYAAVVAALIASLLALGVLIRFRVYRPLLVLLAVMISLWGIVQLTWELAFYWGLLVAVVAYALGFGVYSWTARLRDFWVTLLVVIVLVLVIRLAIVL